MSILNNIWKSNGKLLLTGEYLVMEGAMALALPINKSQTLSIKFNNCNLIRWQAIKPDGIWFLAEFLLPTLDIKLSTNSELAKRLKSILISTRDLSKSFLMDKVGYNVETELDFNPEFGFGTSSTLISNIANWANVDPYLLLKNTFGGSGYDIACARSNNPILFHRFNDTISVSDVEFNPKFKDKLYFVYLGSKQSSSNEISNFKENCKFSSLDIDSISAITNEIYKTGELAEFEDLIAEHESIMSKILKLKTAKELHFPDFKGGVKSLGAWGGDFVLISSNRSENDVILYLKSMGYNTVYPFSSLVL